MGINPIKTDKTNVIYVAKGCNDLPATQHLVDNMELTETCWQLTEEEIQKITETGNIYYSVVGKTIVPMFLHVDSMIEE